VFKLRFNPRQLGFGTLLLGLMRRGRDLLEDVLGQQQMLAQLKQLQHLARITRITLGRPRKDFFEPC
jgi:hypothetical protein